jgi:hypothetical protein
VICSKREPLDFLSGRGCHVDLVDLVEGVILVDLVEGVILVDLVEGVMSMSNSVRL